MQIAVYDEGWELVHSTVTRVAADRAYMMFFYLAEGREGAYRLQIMRDLHNWQQMEASEE